MKHDLLNGIDNASALMAALRGHRLGLVTNPSAVNRDYLPAADVINDHLQVTTFFAPEHGLRGDLQNGVPSQDYTDPRTGKDVLALYGAHAHVTDDRLHGIDTMVYDIQDVGARVFSFLTTLATLMEDCIKFDRSLVVLDRMNPLGGWANEGLMAEPQFDRWWGYGVPMRFSLTIGEYARMVNDTYYHNACRLTVVPCLNWHRDMAFPQTARQWCNPTPNLPNFNSALIYAGAVMFGQTTVSEARGTTRPYEMYGAPDLDAHALADRLNQRNLPGVLFRPCAFMPEYNAFDKYIKTTCNGIRLFITDHRTYNSFETGMWMMDTFRELYPNFAIPFPNDACSPKTFDSGLGSSDWRTGRLSTEDVIQRAREESARFAKQAQKYMIYH